MVVPIRAQGWQNMTTWTGESRAPVCPAPSRSGTGGESAEPLGHWCRRQELVARTLTRRCPEIPVLHDRRMPDGAGNIDHVAVAASRVYVIDAKRYRGKIEIRRPLFGEPKLTIAGRDRTRLGWSPQAGRRRRGRPRRPRAGGAGPRMLLLHRTGRPIADVGLPSYGRCASTTSRCSIRADSPDVSRRRARVKSRDVV